MSDRSGALDGLCIVDMTHVFQGPVGMQLLGDLGGDVIKIERPGSGDWSRRWGPYIDDVSMPFVSLNRNKRSLTLDLKAPRGKEILLRLLERADVLAHNFRPGVMMRLGLDYETLSALNPRLIYAQSSGWGDKGPYVESGRGGHDLMARATSGLFAPLGEGGLPVPAGISVDYPAGLMLVIAILAALQSRERTGRGQMVSTDLLSVGFHSHAWDDAATLNSARLEQKAGVGSSEQAIRSSFRTQDGFVEISAVFTDDALRDISVALGMDDLSQDDRFRDKAQRPARADEINALLDARFATKNTQEWIKMLAPQGILCAEIKTFAEAAEDPQVLANDMVVDMAHPTLGSLRLLGTPIRMYGSPTSLRMPPPALGEHNNEILHGLGYSTEEIDALKADGVVGQTPG